MNNITKVKQLRTEYIQVWSVSRCLLLGEKKNPQNCISLLSVFVFPTVNVFLEGDRAGSWWKQFIFLDEADQEMEESLRAQRLRAAHNNVLWGPRPPHTECDFERTPSQNQCNGTEFLATAITVSGPSVYLLVFTCGCFEFCVLSFEKWHEVSVISAKMIVKTVKHVCT